MIKILKTLFVLIVTFFLVWYLAKNWQQLEQLLDFSATHIVAMYLLCGLLFIINAFADKIITLLKDTSLLEQLKKQTRGKMINKFNWKIISERYTGIIKDVI